MWDTARGSQSQGGREGGGGFLLLSTFLLVALMSYQILLLCGAQPGPARLSDPVYIEPQERSVSVSGFS